MGMSSSIAGYPDWFFTIAERAQKPGYEERVSVSSRGVAVNLRQRFYKWRQLIAAAQHPHAGECLGLVLTLEEESGKHYICFSKNAGLTAEAITQLGISVSKEAPAPANASDRVSTSDAAEDALNKLLFGEKGRAPAAEQMRQCPPHEWDKLGVFCLHCGKPKEEGEA